MIDHGTGTVALALPSAETERVAGEARGLTARASALQVTDAGSYGAAAELRRACRGVLGAIGAVYRPLAKTLHEAHGHILAQERAQMAPVEAADRQLAARMLAWQDAEERRAREERRRLEELAREEAEAARREAETQALEDAAALERGGCHEAAAEVLEDAASQPPAEAPCIVVMSSVPKVIGISQRETWRFEVTDAAVIPREYLIPDEKRIGGVVRAMKGATRIPGVRVWPERSHAVRA